MAPTGNPQLGMRQALAIPAFRKLWLAQLVSVFGDFLALYAVLSAMSFRMHASARAITLVSVFFLLPMALIGPLAGVFVDRWSPKRTLVTSDFARALLLLARRPRDHDHRAWRRGPTPFAVRAVRLRFAHLPPTCTEEQKCSGGTTSLR